MPRRATARRAQFPAAALIALAAAAGAGCGDREGAVVARYDGGEVTAEELHAEAKRLPPVLRARFETEAGRRDLVAAMVDQRLLAQEAQRRKLHEAPEVRREVEALEDRLAIQALLAAEEKAMGPASEAELRAWYEGHRDELAEPERVQVRRALAAAAPGATKGERERARARATAFAARLRAGEPMEKVAADGDGPERSRGGDLGLLARGDRKDPALEAAAFALAGPGARSPVVETAEGFVVLELVARRPGHVPALEDVRSDVANRLAPARKRRAFDELLARLRRDADVTVETRATR